MQMKRKIRVLIVDDSAVVRQTISAIISEEDDIEVIGMPRIPITAQKKLQKRSLTSLYLTLKCPGWTG